MRLSHSAAGIRVRLSAAVQVLLAATVVNAGSTAGAGPGSAAGAAGGQCGAERRDRDARRGQRNPRGLFGADGDAGEHSRTCYRTVLQRHAGNPRLVPVVGDDHPHLYSRRETAAAVCDQVRGDDRGNGHRGQRPPARTAPPVQLHDADRQASQHQLVPPRWTRRRADGRDAPLQPACPRGRAAAAPACGVHAARLGGTGAFRGRTRAPQSHRPRVRSTVQRQGRGDPRDRECDRSGDRAPDHRLGQEAIPRITGPRRARNDDAGAARIVGASVGVDNRAIAGGPGEAAGGVVVRHPDRARVLRRQLRLRARMSGRRGQSPSLQGAGANDCPCGGGASRRRDLAWPAGPRLEAEARGRHGARGRARRGRVLHARGRRLQSAAAGADVCRDGRCIAAFGRRSDARLHLGGRCRELACAGLYQLRRRPRRVGTIRRQAAAVLRAELPHR